MADFSAPPAIVQPAPQGWERRNGLLLVRKRDEPDSRRALEAHTANLIMGPLIGFWGGGAAVPLTSVVQQASATSTAAAITAPADIQSGDLLVLGDFAIAAGVPTTVIPSGWTSAANTNDGSAFKTIFSFKIADGSEASSSITGMDGLVDIKVLLVFRGNVSIVTAAPNTFGAQATTGNPTAQNVTASGGTPPLVVFGIYSSNGTVDPRTFSPAKDGEVSSTAGFYVAWKIYNSSPADVSIDMDDEGTNILQSGYISLTS